MPEVGVYEAKTHLPRSLERDWSRIGGDLAALAIVGDVQPRDLVLRAVLPLAVQRGLSVYDAVCLELAARRGLPLATLDRTLARACVTPGVVAP
ncbi:MAG: type II toxin-antitoxin system VapC family toxin [Deferrisomatales bacterium]